MKKFLIPIVFCITSAQAQTYFYAPQINIDNLKQSYKAVGYDFGYQDDSSSRIESGYYIWIENEWFQIINAKKIFNASSNHLAFSIDDIKNQKLTLKDGEETIFFYPIEALDKYRIASDRFNKLTSLVVENNENVVSYSEAQISGNEVRIKNTIEDKKDGVNLDEISITTKVIERVIPYEGENEETQKNTSDKSKEDSSKEAVKIIGEDTLLIRENNTEKTDDSVKIIGEDTLLIKENKSKTEDKKTEPKKNNNSPQIIGEDSIRVPVNKKEANEYEKAIADGFEGTVTEWFEYEIQKNGISPYEKAVAAGFEGTEDEYKRTLWGSSLPVEMQQRERDAKLVTDWLQKVGTSEGLTPYERALKHGFYGTFTEWVEFVIGKDGEKVYEEEVARKEFEGTYRQWVESKLNASNEALKRKDALTSQKFVAVPNLALSIPEDDETVATFSLYDYYQMYFGNSVVSSSSNTSTNYQLKPTEIEYQVTWYNRKEITITKLSTEGILYYKKNPIFNGNSTSINVKFVLK